MLSAFILYLMKILDLHIPKNPAAANIGICVFVLILAQALLNLFYTGLLNSDEFEHIHASWLVWSGKTPYLNFFEHHNPLLWYLFAPLTGLMFDNVNVYYICRFVTLAANLASWYFIYKIIRAWLGDSKVWLSAFVLFCCGDYVSRNLVEFRPDVFMNLCFWSGLYFYLTYFQNKRPICLTTAFILFTLAFFFLQKIILLLTFLGIYTFLQLLQKQIKPADFLKALIIPLVLVLLFICWLFYHNMLGLYFELNYTLNSLLPQYYGLHQVKFIIFGVMLHLPFNNGWASVFFPPAAIILCAAAILCYHKVLLRKNTAAQVLVILFFAELTIRFFTFSPYAHYFSLLETLAAILIASALFGNDTKFKTAIYNIFLFIAFIISASLLFCDYSQRNADAKLQPALDTARFVIENTEPDEAVMNAANYNFNLFRPDAGYVWFMLNDIGYIYETNFAVKTNFDDIVNTKKATLIYAENYINTPLSERRVKKLFEYNTDLMSLYRNKPLQDYKLTDLLVKIPQPDAYIWDMQLIKKYYRPTAKNPFWILKDEYRKKKEK